MRKIPAWSSYFNSKKILIRFLKNVKIQAQYILQVRRDP